MLYDMKAHVPQLMDKMLECFSEGEVDKLSRYKTMIVKTLESTDIVKKMSLIESKKTEKVKALEDDVKSSLRKSVEKEDASEIWMESQQLWERYVHRLDTIELNYWETVISKIKETVDGIESVEQ